MGVKFLPSSDIGSDWSDQLGLGTYEARSDVLAIAGRYHISELIFGIYAKLGASRVFCGPFGFSCAELRFGFGLPDWISGQSLRTLLCFVQFRAETPKPIRKSAQESPKGSIKTLCTPNFAKIPNLNPEIRWLPVIAIYSPSRQSWTLPCKSEPTWSNAPDIQSRHKILTQESQTCNCTQSTALRRKRDPMVKFIFSWVCPNGEILFWAFLSSKRMRMVFLTPECDICVLCGTYQRDLHSWNFHVCSLDDSLLHA